MHAHEYGSKHFKHKTNFNGLVVFSDVQQQKIKETTVPSPNIYVEIEKGVQNPNKWFLHINSTLSGEYGDFFLQENPQPVGEILNDFDYDISPENTAFIESYYDFSLGEISYYKINEKFYIKLWGDILKDDVFFEIQNSSKSKQKEEISIEYDAFITVFVSDNGAKLERAYQNITKVNTHQIVVFIESGGGTNAFGTVFRIHKGKNVKTLPEVDRLTLSKVAKAFGVQVQTNDLSEMIKEELAEEDSVFYLLVTKKLLKGGRIIRWSTKDVFTDISGGLKNASKEVNKLKLGEERWNTAFKDESGSKYNPLLPKLRGEDNLFDVEKFSNDVYKTYIQPAATQATSIAKLLLKKRRFAKLIPFDISKVIEVLDAIPTQLRDFFDSVSNHLLNLYEYINGLLVGLINSIIEFVKSFIDILAMLFDVLNAAIQSTEFFENPASYLSLFAESFENLMDSFVALFTLENLKAIFGFIASMPAYAVKIVFRFLTSDIKVKIDPGALGYYIGFFVGFVASEVVTFFLTGGTGTIAKALKETLRSYKALAEIPKKAAKALGNTVQFGIDTFVKVGTIIADFIKNIPKHLKTLRKWLDEFFEGLSKATRTFRDDIYTLFEKLDVAIKKVPQQPVLASGVPVPVGENLYALVKDGKELFRGTKKEVEELAEKLKKLNEADAKKYLDELEEIGAYEKQISIIAKGNYVKVFLKTNIDVFDEFGNIIFRVAKEDFESFIKFTKKTKEERKKIIEKVNKRLRASSSKYNPENAKKKGYDIPMSKNGTSPDFKGTSHLYNDKSIVRIQIKGSRDLDFKESFKKMGITDRKKQKAILKNYTWHHLDDLDENLGCTMQLVSRKAHKATYKHFGSAGQSVFSILLTKYLT
ncbi:HNH/ENDO VII superfamily nuclease [Tenacibaculum gallaicum]|uniref:HNH/ENDO VII superfamily nuclease n=1 Tax=Tenacibaculum gallaicum TaxID=561505 RepID=A0A3E0IBY2_9FLAO|nr:HNH endonuclease [Tenacibaculum gallaicum]REH56256.1 HNH/ENDO VII superfamily nuclease [Tenacibaculum gallaicum]